MGKIDFKYRLDDLPPLGETLLYGLQWLIITVPIVIIVGQVAAELHYDQASLQVSYIQKLFFVSGAAMLAQLFLGHRMPVIVGPATVLLVGIVASLGEDLHEIYSAIMIGGLILGLVSITGFFGHLKKLFTSRVVATVLILIAFTLTPMIVNLIAGSGAHGNGFYRLPFAIAFVLAMFVANRQLTGIWKATLILWAILLGSGLYALLFPQEATGNLTEFALFSGFMNDFRFHFSLNAGLIISFLFCFLALAINDLGSIQAVGEIVQPDNLEKRITRGITVSGLGNVLAGVLGVPGPVNFSLTPGVITSTGCASRHTLTPMALGLIALSLMPKAIALMSHIPLLITGSIILYIMCSQVAAGLVICTNSLEEFKLEHGLIMGLPLLLGIVISFLPDHVLTDFPDLLRPVLSNGFAVGVFTVLIMEHLIFRRH